MRTCTETNCTEIAVWTTKSNEPFCRSHAVAHCDTMVTGLTETIKDWAPADRVNIDIDIDEMRVVAARLRAAA